MLGSKWSGLNFPALICRMDCGSIRGIADEVDCGISAFANLELKPIGGSLKSFPEDFVVEEFAGG